MKKIAIAALLFISLNSFAQSRTQITNLAKIAQAWGFLKYYHPAFAKGTIGGDTVLFRLLPLSTQGRKDFDVALSNWYRTLPKASISAIPTQPKGDSILTIFNERDIRKFNLNAHLTEAFIQLYAFHLPDSNRYLTNRYKQYTLDILLNKEAEFNENPYPNRELRLLSLFRYWNIINYQYPHKRNIDPWNRVLLQFIPLFWQAKDKGEYQDAVRKLIAATRDSHSFYKEEADGRNQALNVAFEISKIDGRYFVSGVYNAEIAAKEGIAKGDEILYVNGLTAKAYERLKLFGITGSTPGAKHRDQARQLLRIDTARSFNLVVNRDGKQHLLKVARYNWATLNKRPSDQLKKEKVLNWQQLEPRVWHVRFCAITSESELKEMFDSIRTAKKVIWDMRGYPVYALLPQALASLMPQQTLLGWNATANLFFPGTFSLKKDMYVPEPAKYAGYHAEMIVLVNEQTQSLAESVSAQLSLRPKTIVMGTQTAGTTGNINYFDLPGGIQTSFTAVGYRGSKGSFVQHKGVKINVRLKASARPTNGKTDVLLQKALRQQLNTK